MKIYKRLFISIVFLILIVTLILFVSHKIGKNNLEKKINFDNSSKDEIISILSGLEKYIYKNDNLNRLIKDYSKENTNIGSRELYNILYANEKYVDVKINRWIKTKNFVDSNNQPFHITFHKEVSRWKSRPKFLVTMWSNGYNKINEDGKGDDVVVFDSVVLTIAQNIAPVPDAQELMALMGKPLPSNPVASFMEEYFMEVQYAKRHHFESKYYGFSFVFYKNKQNLTILTELSLYINNVTYMGSMKNYKIYKGKLPLGLKRNNTAEEIIQRFHISNKDRYSTWMDYLDEKNNYKYTFYFPDGELINTITISPINEGPAN